MPAYSYPITIKRDPQKVRYTNNIEVESDIFTLAELRKYVKEEERFSIIQNENTRFGSYILSVSGERLETPKETASRVEKEEAYMEKYNSNHANKQTP